MFANVHTCADTSILVWTASSHLGIIMIASRQLLQRRLQAQYFDAYIIASRMPAATSSAGSTSRRLHHYIL
jgi:hypothetical protein